MDTMNIPSDYVLVVGAVHWDTVANFPASQSGLRDKVGTVHYSVGGTAFNVAANLALHDVPVCIYTHLRPGIASEIILRQCQALEICMKFSVLDSTVPEAGFVAHRVGDEIVSSVSAIGIGEAHLRPDYLLPALRECRFAVADCNMSETQLGILSQIASDEGKALLVAGVSEAKIGRVRATANGSHRPPYLLSMNQATAESLMHAPFGDWSGDDVLAAAHAKRVLVSRGESGCVLYSEGRQAVFEAPEVERIVSTMGTGDALLSAFCASLYEEGELAGPGIRANISRFVGDSLKTTLAVPLPTRR